MAEGKVPLSPNVHLRATDLKYGTASIPSNTGRRPKARTQKCVVSLSTQKYY